MFEKLKRFLFGSAEEQPRHFDNLTYYIQFKNLADDAAHVLVAGATGSGKSVFINDFIYSLSAFGNADYILLDPKRVELVRWRNTLDCVGYACENDDMIGYLNGAISEMDRRYRQMAKKGIVKWDGDDRWIIIDELADLMVTDKKRVMPLLQRIAQLGRAAGIHLLCATQSPSRKTIPAELTLNFTHKIALRCDSAIESRQIIGTDGAEDLPKYGKGLLHRPGGLAWFPIPLTDEDKLKERIALLQK